MQPSNIINNISSNFPKLSLKAPRELKKVTPYKVKSNENLYKIFIERKKRLPNTALFQFEQNNEYKIWSASDFIEEVNSIAKGLISYGIKKGDSVAIMSKTSIEWILLDISIMSLGAITVPIYETDSSSQIKFILNDANVKILFVENKNLFDKASRASKKTNLGKIYNLEYNIIEEFKVLGSKIKDKDLLDIQSTVTANDLATIVYTSGSTGTPKGVELTHKAIIFVSKNAVKHINEYLLMPNSKFLLFLPLAHIFARFAVFAMASGVSETCIAGGIDKLLPSLQYYQPDYTIAVPRVFEKVINAASQKAGSGIKGAIFKEAQKFAIKYSQALDSKYGVGPQMIAQHKIFDTLVYSQIRDIFGGKMKICVSGGAPLSQNAAHFFRGAGITILEGYGLTETVAPIFASYVNNINIGTIGFPFPGVEYKIDKNNELIVKTESLFQKYHNDKELTDKILKRGWFKTGDLAKIMPNGCVKLIGRDKDLIITSGGKNVSPSIIESYVQDNELIEHCVLVGDRRQFIGAIVTLDQDFFRVFSQKKLGGITLDKAIDNIILNNYIQNIFDKANKLVSRAESVRKFIILEDNFTLENSMLTTSMKIKRSYITDKYKSLIDTKIYKR